MTLSKKRQNLVKQSSLTHVDGLKRLCGRLLFRTVFSFNSE